MITLEVNGQTHQVDDEGAPLLYVLRNDLGLNGAKFGCGLAQCGACTVMVDGTAVFSCVIPAAAVAGRKITTVEGLGTVENPGPVQRAFIDQQAAQCGYCTAGMIMRAQSLLTKNASPEEDEIRAHMRPNLCRCGTHMRILAAVRQAAGMTRASAVAEQASAP